MRFWLQLNEIFDRICAPKTWSGVFSTGLKDPAIGKNMVIVRAVPKAYLFK
jgi:hypothetical protein